MTEQDSVHLYVILFSQMNVLQIFLTESLSLFITFFFFLSFFFLLPYPILPLWTKMFACYSFGHMNKQKFIATWFSGICTGKYWLKRVTGNILLFSG